MMRMKKLLDQRGGVIDHHSDAGAFCVSPAMIYMEHYPFISKLWYGVSLPCPRTRARENAARAAP